jgi:hypothetical protein
MFLKHLVKFFESTVFRYVKWEMMNVYRLAANNHNWKCVGRTAEGMSDVCESEVLVMFVTLDGDGTARNISGRLRIT